MTCYKSDAFSGSLVSRPMSSSVIVLLGVGLSLVAFLAIENDRSDLIFAA